MIKPLQSRHKTLWVILAVLLPLGFLSALMVIPEPAMDNPVLSKLGMRLPIARTIQTEDFIYHLRQSTDQAGAQIEIWIKNPLTYPSVIVNVEYENGEIAPVGILGPKGVYLFSLPDGNPIPGSLTIILSDQIKDVELEKVKL